LLVPPDEEPPDEPPLLLPPDELPFPEGPPLLPPFFFPVGGGALSSSSSSPDGGGFEVGFVVVVAVFAAGFAFELLSSSSPLRSLPFDAGSTEGVEQPKAAANPRRAEPTTRGVIFMSA
jgi:hypothetical protein